MQRAEKPIAVPTSRIRAGLFVLQEKLAGYKDGLKAGTYTLNTSMTPDEMIQIMAASSEEDQDGEGS